MAAPSFGLSPGLGLGSNPQQTTQQQTGFSFSTPSAPAVPSFGFGTPATSTAPAFGSTGFGLTTPTQTTQSSLFTQSGGSLSFGTPVATTTASTQPTLSFGQTTVSTPQTAFGFGTPTTATAPQTGFGFGAPTSTAPTSTPTPAFGFGSPATSAPTSTGAPSLSFSLPPASTSAPPPTPGFLSTTTTSAPGLFSSAKPSFGLSNTSLFAPKPPVTSAAGNLGGEVTPPSLIKAVKDNPIPPEMLQLIDGFKQFIKREKNCSSEVARCSVKPLQKTCEDIESVKHLLGKLERSVNVNKSMGGKVKADTLRCAADVEMAQRTLEISPGYQSDNLAPLDYFTLLADRFQEQVVLLRVEIEKTERHMQSALDPTALSPDELNDSMRRLHECFVALAGRLHLVHSTVSNLKQSHLDLRRKRTSDPTDIYDRKTGGRSSSGAQQATPNRTLTAASLYSSVAALVRASAPPPTNDPAPPPSPFPLLPPSDPSASPSALPGVQLKSPPGSKRGKR